MIPVLGSQHADDVSHKPAVGCHYFPRGLQLPLQPLRGLLLISPLGEQRHDRWIKLTYVGFRAHVKIASRIVSYRVNSLPKTVTGQRRGLDLNPGPTAPEASTLTTRLPSHPECKMLLIQNHTACLSIHCSCFRMLEYAQNSKVC